MELITVTCKCGEEYDIQPLLVADQSVCKKCRKKKKPKRWLDPYIPKEEK